MEEKAGRELQAAAAEFLDIAVVVGRLAVKLCSQGDLLGRLPGCRGAAERDGVALQFGQEIPVAERQPAGKAGQFQRAVDLSPEERLLRAIFGEKAGDVRDASLKAPPGMEGIVVDIKLFARRERDDRGKSEEKKKIERLRRVLRKGAGRPRSIPPPKERSRSPPPARVYRSRRPSNRSDRYCPAV